jgi:hypothetical protein
VVSKSVLQLAANMLITKKKRKTGILTIALRKVEQI